MKTPFDRYALAITLLLIMLAQLSAASPSQSAAFDEGYTITYGYAYLRGGDARLSRGQNPPLTNVLIALPLLLKDDIVFPADDTSWTEPDIFGFSDQFMWRVNPNPQRMVLLARLPEMLLALLLACVVYAFTRLMFGEVAALAALAVCAFDPNVLAHGHIVGTDLGVSFFMFAAVWAWAAALKCGNLNRVLVAGLLAGAALSTKYSAVWLGPILLLIGLIFPMNQGRFATRVKLLIALGVAAGVVVWGTFAFSIGPIEPGGPAVPAPQYWQSLAGVRTRIELSTPAFMLGQLSASGFPGYYPFTFLVKTPLPTLILLLIGGASLIRRRARREVAVWAPPVLFMLAAMFGGLNLGYRLMLPVLPFAIVLAGQGAAVLVQPSTRPGAMKPLARTWRLGGVAVLLIWLAVDVVSINPQHLAYFNPLVNRERDYDVLVDSNLDWGQDLIALREWQRSRQIDDLNLAYYGSARPEAYGLNMNLLPSFSLRDYGPEIDGFTANALKPGWYAVSVSSLQLGLLYSRWGLYEPFRNLPPVERVGRSFLIYHVTYPLNDSDRTVVLGPHASDLDAATLGKQADRRLIVKWAGENAAVIDLQGAARYVARGGEPIVGFAPAVHKALIDAGQRLGNDASGDLRLWQIDARTTLTDVLNRLENQPIFAPDGSPLKLPVAFDGGLALIGYELAASPALELTTYWRVEHPITLPVSIFAHAVDAQQQIVAQADGLHVTVSVLESGDLVIQRLPIGSAPAAESINLGVYDPTTLQRRTLAADTQRDHVVVELK